MPARPPRTEEVQQERRRRSAGTLDRMQQLKLAVPETVQEDHPDHTFRWINDSGNRMHAMTVQDDWDKVEGVPPQPVGTDKEGKPVYAHLCKKRQEFWDEDQKAKIEATREQERGLLRAAKGDPQSSPDGASYEVPGNLIQSGYTP